MVAADRRERGHVVIVPLKTWNLHLHTSWFLSNKPEEQMSQRWSWTSLSLTVWRFMVLGGDMFSKVPLILWVWSTSGEESLFHTVMMDPSSVQQSRGNHTDQHLELCFLPIYSYFLVCILSFVNRWGFFFYPFCLILMSLHHLFSGCPSLSCGHDVTLMGIS